MKTLQELQVLILQWAKDKDLLKLENAPKQRLKLLEEVGETAGAILKNNTDEIKDGIGDIFVVLVILAEQLNKNIIFEYEDGGDVEMIDDLISELLNTTFGNNDLEYFISYLLDICTKLNIDLKECASLAWDEIKDRKGNTINGTFIKNN